MRGRLPTIVVAAVILGGQVLSAEHAGLPSLLAPERPDVAVTVLATAAEGGWAAPERRLLIAIGDWLSAAYGVPSLSAAPELLFASPRDLIARRYPMLLGVDATLGSDQPDLVAVYDDRERTIYVSTEWMASDATGMSVLVHEMVHHMQNEAGMRFACPEEREKQAFAAQEEWLAMSGSSLETAFGIDPLTLLVRSSCIY